MKIIIILILVLGLALTFASSIEPFEMKNIIVTMTTIPERIESNTIVKTLDSISRQTRLPTQIYINVAKRKNNKDYPLDKLYKITNKYKNIIINVIDVDLGPITKILPTLQYIKPHDYVILIDDDVTYIPEMIEQLINANKNAVGYAGRINNEFVTSSNYSGPVDFLETFAGVLYSGDALLGLNDYFYTVKDICEKQDDIIIGAFLKSKGIIPEIGKSLKNSSVHDAEGTPQLNELNLKTGNMNCYTRIWK